MRVKLRLAIMAFVIVIAAVAAGCSGTGDSGDKDGAEIAVEGGEKGSVTITTDAGKTVLSSESEWPESFPDEIPKPEGMKVTASSQNDAGNTTVSIETEKPFDEVVKLYQEYVRSAGYAQTLEMKESGYYMYSGTRGKEMFMFTLGLDQEDKRTVTGAFVYEIKG
ncbi:hypothetical protein ACFPPD_19980 [Cohnella suwonensis]|uniref:Lipoprotein n=1 Tax=Cohnella suwonensis TaxID=696072 RepID=A0ABW0M2E3_9BACL